MLGERVCAVILNCWIEDEAHYDHKRSHAERPGLSEWQGSTTAVAAKHTEWKFFIERADSSVISLHPYYKDGKVGY